ncbi:2-C-methyl-D-erythritol 2,4-cyclodiphosphate synthase [bacterium]|nr:2-C-methyl-D-erythritol 2,4-cyclodiphosphate synthase [bacterium]
MIRVGQGFDVHAFAPGRPLKLCGVIIPYELGLLGHSDADVAIHALMDALLGAAALGDIGKLFPDNDQKYEGADSTLLLKEVVALLHENNYKIVNFDITIIAQEPKISPYVGSMRAIMAPCCGIPLDCVSVKATTTEKLGFTGRKEGIAALACALIEKI